MDCTRTPVESGSMLYPRSLTKWSTIVPASPADFDSLISFPIELHSELAHPKSCLPSCKPCDREICAYNVLPSPMDFHNHIPNMRSSALDASGAYPSPPPSGSRTTGSVPLPGSSFGFLQVEAGGVLDSPSIIRRITQFPLSPPPTAPTSTTDLPLAEMDQREDASFLPSPEPEGLLLYNARGDDGHDGKNELQYDTISSSKPTFQPLSPLSPEWDHASISERPTKSAGQPHLSDLPSPLSSFLSELSLDDDHSTQHTFTLEDAGKFSLPFFSDFDILSPPPGIITKNLAEIASAQYSDSGESGRIRIDRESILESSPLSHFGARASFWGPQDFTCYSPCRRKAILLDEPPEAGALHPPLKGHSALLLSDASLTEHPDQVAKACVDAAQIPGSPDSDDFPDNDDSTNDPDEEPSDQHNIHSPLPLLATSSNVFNDFSISSFSPPCPSLPDSPLPKGISLLPDDEDEITLIESPTPSVQELPALDGVDDIFLSPTQSILSLPGAETDNDLIPSAPLEFSPRTYSSSLLLFDDGNDLPTRRSPSPEDLNIELDPSCEAYPEFEQLRELSRKSNSVERAARQMEDHLLEQGAIQARNEARRLRKVEKEKGKEIIALLRLKLGKDLVGNLERGRASSSIASASQLVARMLLRRRETSRSLAERRAPILCPSVHTPSPLSRIVSTEDVE